eukprot:2636467-Pleurochrysis_carterae.AAC.2
MSSSELSKVCSHSICAASVTALLTVQTEELLIKEGTHLHVVVNELLVRASATSVKVSLAPLL